MPRARSILALAALTAACMIPPQAMAETINVSRIVTGTKMAVPAGEPLARVMRLPAPADFALGTAAVGPANAQMFDPQPWTSAPSFPAPTPKLSLSQPLADYTKNGVHYVYAQHFTGQAAVDMTAGGAVAKTVSVQTFQTGGAQAQTSYRMVITPPKTGSLDYFLNLSVPQLVVTLGAGYSFCCAGDSNGGTYHDVAPTSVLGRLVVDLYADDLPIWSTERIFVYPSTDKPVLGIKAQTIDLGQPAIAGTTTLYLGRLAAGTPVTITLIARAEGHAESDCGTEVSGGPPGDYVNTRRCTATSATISLKSATTNAPPGFTITARTPK